MGKGKFIAEMDILLTVPLVMLLALMVNGIFVWHMKVGGVLV
jgi:hypothetical protein